MGGDDLNLYLEKSTIKGLWNYFYKPFLCVYGMFSCNSFWNRER